MPVDFAAALYSHTQNQFGRPITVSPLKSQPGMPAYQGRGIYMSEADDVSAEESVVFSDQRTTLDVISVEFEVLPMKGDQINIPAVGGIPAAGLFEILDVDDNGGGESTFSLRKIVPPKPAAPTP